MNTSELKTKAAWVRKKVLESAGREGAGHVSTAFSQTEILVALYYGGIFDPTCDRLILSKGHGAIGLYPILNDLGLAPEDTYGTHCDPNVPGVDWLTGSLGHGLPVAVGMATAMKKKAPDALVFCVLGDGDLCEGATWEAAMHAHDQMLSNLIAIVDRNGQGYLGWTEGKRDGRDGPSLVPTEQRFRNYCWETRTCLGHDFPNLLEKLQDVRTRQNRTTDAGWFYRFPLCIVAYTRKGWPASCMMGRPLWHGRVPTGEDYESTLADIERAAQCKQ